MYISEWIYWPDPTKFRETIAASMAMGELWKKHGATDARLSSLNGSDMGCLANTIAFDNADSFNDLLCAGDDGFFRGRRCRQHLGSRLGIWRL